MTRLLLPLVIAATVWTGSMTWYSLPGQIQRNGLPFSDDALTCAVDDSWWDRTTDRAIHENLTVCASGVCTNVAVTDTGWLADYDVLIDCTQAVWRRLGIPLAVGRQQVIVRASNITCSGDKSRPNYHSRKDKEEAK